MNKKIFSIVMTFVLVFSTFAFAVNAEPVDALAHVHEDDEIVVVFEAGASEIAKAKVTAHFTGEDEGTASPAGILCSLAGHKIETGACTTITHKRRSSAPRCLEEYFNYEVCTRCDDYANFTLLGSKYIYCC